MVNQLRDELKMRGCSQKGKKAELWSRLVKAIEDKIPLVENLTIDKANLAGDSFSPGAYWDLLECKGDYVEDKTSEGFRAPTDPADEVSQVKKRNYAQKFDRMVFSGKTELPAMRRDGRLKKNKQGKVKYEIRAHNKTEAKMTFIRKNNLNVDSHPAEWFGAFVPIKSKGNDQNDFSMESLNRWTNIRALMENAGGLGGKYEDFVNFSTDELMKHIGIYLLQALSPLPQVEMKFHSQVEDPVNGSDLVHRSFGGIAWKSEKRHRHFKAFFCSVNPMLNVPSRDTHPNWKIHPFLKHILNVSKEAVFLGRNLSCDEQTVGFQGNHKDKQRITYKKEGDGFLADCICSDGYTYSFHFRHQAASRKITDTFKCSPLHARVLGLISQLPDKYYTLGMDNLYNSTKLCRLAYAMDQKVMVHGVTRPSLRGIPPAIKMDELTRKKDLEKVRHTVKAAVLKGDQVIQDLVAVACYDTKPVYFLSSACEEIKWIEKKRKVFDPNEKKTVDIPFYRLNIIDFYNYNMGNVDLADQLRNQYRYDSAWHRNRKWWWAIWWWGYQLLLTNSYVLYVKFHRLHGSKNYCTHYEYIKQIGLAWVNQEMYGPKKIKKVSNKREKEQDGSLTRATKRKIEAVMMSASSSTSRCIQITNESLCPHGQLKRRLNTSFQHLPEVPNAKKPRCQLHRWARDRSGTEVFSGVITCSVCRVNLCVRCYNIFHMEPFLTCKKSAIASS